MIKERPHRLDLIYVNQPLYFVTFATRDRRSIPSLGRAQLALEQYGRCAIAKFNVALGRYVMMPDHVHLFVRGGPDFTLSSWIGGLKRAMSVALLKETQATRLPLQRGSLWQPGFFDHILRSDESYAEKWNYVRDNPVRAGLVQRPTGHTREKSSSSIERDSCSGRRVAYKVLTVVAGVSPAEI